MPQRWQWTEQKRQAFALLDTGEHSQAEVAELLGVTQRTIEGWARHPAWRALRAEREQELERQFAADNALWWSDFARRKAEQERIRQEHLADFERQLQATAAADFGWYRRPGATTNEPKRRKPGA